MKKITKFEGKKITIDGKVGTIHQEKRNGFCEFVHRSEGAIKSMRIAGRYIEGVGVKEYAIRDRFRDIVDSSIQTHNPVLTHWSGYYPNGEYIGRDFSLKEAGM